MNAQQIRTDLSRALGNRHVRWDDQTLAEHAHDNWPLSLLHLHQGRLSTRPLCVVRVRSTDEVSVVLSYANSHGVPVVPFGGGSGVCGGVRPGPEAIVIDLRDMNELVDLNEITLTARVQAGMIGEAFETALNDRGYSMGHFPQSIALSTVGGWVATRAAGQFSTRYGSIEDMLLGLDVVLPGGNIVRIKPVPRRSTGPDLRHLFLGSEGTLGVVTELVVRVFPLPESRKLQSFAFSDFHTGLDAVRLIVRAGWRPPVVRLYDETDTALHFGEWARGNDCFLLLISEGSVSLASAEAEATHHECTALGGQPKGDRPVRHWLAERNNVPDLMQFIDKGFVLDTIEVSCGWDRVHDLYRDVVAKMGAATEVVMISGHSSHSYAQGTNIYFTFVAKPDDPAQAEATYAECWERTMEATLRCGGSISHHHGIGRMRARWMGDEHGEGLALLRTVKRAIDPKEIMNPGVLLPDED